MTASGRPSTDPTRVAVVGAGISGLAAAHEMCRPDDEPGDRGEAAHVTVFDGADRVGGRIRATPFAGVAAVDEGADAFLARTPDAVRLAGEVGVDDLTHPQPVTAAVWHDGLHPIPEGLMLGVPGKVLPMARTGLLSWRGKARAALEPLLPRTSTEPDSIGRFVRSRFGDEVHERLVDALVGSIYAADTDRFSLAEVPQLHALAGTHRSLLVGARQMRAAMPTPPRGAAPAPIVAAPTSGVGDLARATADAVVAAGGDVRLGRGVSTVRAVDGGWEIDGERFDAVILATPPRVAATIVGDVAPDAAALLASAESADVVLVTMHLPAGEWPDRLAGSSGYLVPKPVQRSVTATSFGSQKWGHWQPPDGGQIVRVSLGRDGQPVLHLSDDEIVERVLDDLHLHVGVRFTPVDVRISRWPGAFAQYRPHHAHWVDRVEAALPAGLYVTGAGYRGIGVPACVKQSRAVAARAVGRARALAD